MQNNLQKIWTTVKIRDDFNSYSVFVIIITKNFHKTDFSWIMAVSYKRFWRDISRGKWHNGCRFDNNVERKIVFRLLSMSNRDVDLALSKNFSVKFLSFYHNFWFNYPFSFKLRMMLFQVTIYYIWPLKLWKRIVLFLELIINLAHQNRLYGSFTVLREVLFLRI